MFDIVTVFHNHTNQRQSEQLQKSLNEHADMKFDWFSVDNTVENRGFAKACNLGAKLGTNPYIGFLNPDLQVMGPIFDPVAQVFTDPRIVITGERFGKADWELKWWGVPDWVCGACFFVRRTFWDETGGFDEQYVWSWEETDLIRTAFKLRRLVRSIELPVFHASPSFDSFKDQNYKNMHFKRSADLYDKKWNRYG